MAYYVTGGAGFIGSNLIKVMNQKNIGNIVVVDNLRNTGKWKNLLGLRFDLIISPEEFLNTASRLKSEDFVFHLGACSNTQEQDADFLLANNYKYTKTLMEACSVGHPMFVYASSAAVYGLDKNFIDSDIVSDMTKLRPLNPYGWSKLLVDQYALSQSKSFKSLGFRFFNVWGPREFHKGGMMSLPSRCLLNPEKEIVMFKDEDKRMARDFIYVDDVCNVMLELAITRTATGVYNLGTGIETTWNELIESFILNHKQYNTEHSIDKINYNVVVKSLPADLKKQYQYTTKADLTKLRKNISFTPTPLNECMKRFINESLQ
jgi:ADP-L-glycero-D-manno-heptose 6-epimerase